MSYHFPLVYLLRLHLETTLPSVHTDIKYISLTIIFPCCCGALVLCVLFELCFAIHYQCCVWDIIGLVDMILIPLGWIL